VDIATVGLILYWCEGSKREDDRRVEFVNSDPNMISVFMRYLRAKDIDEARIRARMTIHVQDDESECKEYWKKVTALRDSQLHLDCGEGPQLLKKAIASRHSRNSP